MKFAASLLASLVAAISYGATTATVTPDSWDLYRGTRLVVRGLPNKGGCVEAAKGQGAGTYTCRTQTGVVVAVTSGASPPPPDRDGDGIPDSSDRCPAEPGPAPTGCPVVAPPAPPADSASPAQGQVFKVVGSGFGQKAKLAPVVRDIGGAAENTLDKQWSGARPRTGGTENNLLNRAAGFNGVQPPHPFVSRFLGGRHNSTESSGQVGVYLDFTRPAMPGYLYVSYYAFVDPKWNFGISSTDDNFKLFNYGTSGGGIDANSWYMEYVCCGETSFSNTAVSPQWHVNDDGKSFNTSTSSWYGGSSANPTKGWQKIELEIAITNASSGGYIKAWVDGKSALSVDTRTDMQPGLDRSIQIGSYARNYPGAGQWQYFADLYVDFSRARLVAANAAAIAKATIIEPQVPRSWKDSEIEATFWQGKLPSGGTVYFFVRTEAGAWIAADKRKVQYSRGRG